jgi:hypothetical protein
MPNRLQFDGKHQQVDSKIIRLIATQGGEIAKFGGGFHRAFTRSFGLTCRGTRPPLLRSSPRERRGAPPTRTAGRGLLRRAATGSPAIRCSTEEVAFESTAGLESSRCDITGLWLLAVVRAAGAVKHAGCGHRRDLHQVRCTKLLRACTHRHKLCGGDHGELY